MIIWHPLTDLVPLDVIDAPGCSIAQGRNLAVDAASGEIVVVTDAGTVADIDWQARLLEPFADPRIDVVGGFFRPQLGSTWARALAATTLPDAHEIDQDTFLPSSRSMAFRRTWFMGGLVYPSWLDYCEDVVWDLSMKRAGARFAFVPDAQVEFAVRRDARSFARQYYLYARGDGKAGLFAKRHFIRYLTYGGLIAIVARSRPVELVAAVVAGMLYLGAPTRRLWKRDRAHGVPVRSTLKALPLVALLRGLGDLSKMIGYLVGQQWRRSRSVSWLNPGDWRRFPPG